MNDQNEVAQKLVDEFDELSRRLVDENPGVQAVIDTYALAARAVDEHDAYLRVVNAQPMTTTSNGSASY